MTNPQNNLNPNYDELLAPLRVDDPGIARRIQEALDAFGYNGGAIRTEVPETAETVAGSTKLSQAEIATRLAPVRPIACLIRAFLLRAATREDDLRRELGDEFFDLCDGAGLWERVEGGVVGRVVIIAEDDRFLLSDHSTTRYGERAKYWVMAIGTSSMRVANSIERRHYGRVLDLCCGGGVQAFYVAKDADEVVAVDRNPRALNFGTFAAAMNGYGHVSFRDSDCYSAVEGETFDLIACNPPYVITPDLQSYYRDGGMGGDRFTEKVLREAPEHLNEGGFLHVLCDVASMDGTGSEARVRKWLEGRGCDVIAVGDKPVTPVAYADKWLKPDANLAEEEREFEKHRWVRNLMDIGVESIENWLFVIRKRTEGGPNWFYVQATPGTVRGRFGHQIARLFRCQDLLRRGDKAIWEAKLRLPAEVRLKQVLRPGTGGWGAESARLTFAEGMIHEYGVDAGAAAMLVHFERERTAELALARIAAEMKTGVEDLRGQLLGFLRHLIGCGVLDPA